MRLTVLGSGSAFSAVGGNAAYCLDSHVLIDCGAPVHHLLPRAGIGIAAIDWILLTHFHADHTFLLPLFLGARVFTVTPSPIRLAGPPGTREYVSRVLRTGYGRNLHDKVMEGLGLETTVLQDGTDCDLGGYSVRAHAVVHTAGPSLSYAITGPDGATVGFSGDTSLCPGVRRTAAEADLMVCECTAWDGPSPTHLWRAEVEELMRGAPHTTFLLSHLSERRTLRGALIAHDLLSLDVVPPGAPPPEPPAALTEA